MTKYKAWTKANDQLLIDMKAMKVPSKVIAKRLGRTAPAVDVRYSTLRLSGQLPTVAATKSANSAKASDTEVLVNRLVKALDANTAALNRLADDAENGVPVRSNGHDKGMFSRLFS